MIQTKTRNHREGPIRPAWPARPAAARLRRTGVGSILARPSVRAIQAYVRLPSDTSAGAIRLTESTEICTKGQTHWLGLTRPWLAGFHPIRDKFHFISPLQ